MLSNEATTRFHFLCGLPFACENGQPYAVWNVHPCRYSATNGDKPKTIYTFIGNHHCKMAGEAEDKVRG